MFSGGAGRPGVELKFGVCRILQCTYLDSDDNLITRIINDLLVLTKSYNPVYICSDSITAGKVLTPL